MIHIKKDITSNLRPYIADAVCRGISEEEFPQLCKNIYLDFSRRSRLPSAPINHGNSKNNDENRNITKLAEEIHGDSCGKSGQSETPKDATARRGSRVTLRGA